MIRDNIDELIKESIKSKNIVKTRVLRDIKNEFLKFKTSANFKGFTDVDEITILKRMYDSHIQSYDIYKNANRMDLAQNEYDEMNIIKEFLPPEISEDDVNKFLDDKGYKTIEKKSMGQIIKEVKASLLGVDGSIVANAVKKRLV